MREKEELKRCAWRRGQTRSFGKKPRGNFKRKIHRESKKKREEKRYHDESIVNLCRSRKEKKRVNRRGGKRVGGSRMEPRKWMSRIGLGKIGGNDEIISKKGPKG